MEYVDSLYSEGDSIKKYIYNIVVNGNTNDYFNLRMIYEDRNNYEILPFSIIMADKYHYKPAYFHAYFLIMSNSRFNLYQIDSLENRERELAYKYLRLSYESKDESAVEIVDSLKIKF